MKRYPKNSNKVKMNLAIDLKEFDLNESKQTIFKTHI